jgi:hypothetical protein
VNRVKFVAVVVACAVTAVTACRSDEEGEEDTATTAAAPASTATAATGESTPGESTPTSTGGTAAGSGAAFGSLENVCGPGDATSASDQGVTETEIDVSTFTDMGFTQNPEFPNTAEVFTAWCNEAGGINGRQIVSNTRDARLVEDRQRMIEACASDFAVVGGGAAFDQAGVNDRLTCMLPEIPAQVVSAANIGSDLQVLVTPIDSEYSIYEGYFGWLVNEAFPESKDAIGIISGDVAVTKDISDSYSNELFPALGATVSYYDLYPAAGASDWTPYAQAIKDGGVRGLIFLGDYRNLAKLEQSLTDIGYQPDWIDANSNAYNQEFLDLAAATLGEQTSYIPLGIHPLELAADNPATQQLVDLFEQYKPDANITLPAVQAFSAWLLFAVAARDCGDELTRRCLYDNAVGYHEGWDGGGLTAPATATDADGNPALCWSAMQATPDGWVLVDVEPDSGLYRCTTQELLITPRGTPATLADVGKTIDDVP